MASEPQPLTELHTRPWPDLLPELLESISSLLPLLDYLTFRGVCRRWRSAPSGRSHITGFSRQSPWLIFYDLDAGNNECYLYCDSHPKCCTVRSPHLRGATAAFSKGSWLLARRGRQLFLYNPFSLAKIDLPQHRVHAEQVLTFTGLPHRPDCKVLVFSRRNGSTLDVSSCLVGENQWQTETLTVSADELDAMVMAVGCRCSGGQCAPGHQPQTILVYGMKDFLVYDYVNKKRVGINPRKSMEKRSTPCCCYDEMEGVHGRDWLQRFGEKGVSISTCGVSLSWGGFVGMMPMVKSVKAAEEAVTESRSIKAAWMEPRFNGKGKRISTKK